MAASLTGIEVYVDKLFDESTPWCAHGPTLLFERVTKGDKAGKRFFACSANRERKECHFFQWEDAKISAKALEVRKKEYEKNKPPYTVGQYYQRKETFVCLAKEDQKFCRTCGLLLLPADWKAHSMHDINTVDDLTTPSHLLQAVENNKTIAQYHFSERTLSFFMNTVHELGFTKVLCIGTPRIHETIIKQSEKCRSFLLDMDHRLGQFFPPSIHCRYNMFNHHFFEGETAKRSFSRFLKSKGRMVVVVDPPFGGLVAVLANTLKLIEEEWKKAQEGDEKLPVLFIFPYFMEKKVLEHMPGFSMLDYKVDYTNHSTFHASRSTGGKHGSPVRIFTNIASSSVTLPGEEGYRYCALCKRWVAAENMHCTKCNSCTSKDGRTYRHCDSCERCVKPSYVHCDTCQFCVLPDKHQCGNRTKEGCFCCGDISHKRRECPNKPAQKRKKPGGGERNENMKKAKKRKWKKSVRKKKP